VADDSQPDVSRRAFVRHASAAAAALAWPTELERFGVRAALLARRGGGQDLWKLVRAEFLIPDDRIYLNIGTLGPQPRIVVDATVEHMRRVAMTYPPGVDWEELKHAVGHLIDADCDGLVFPRNTTEGMNFVANGLELAPGDEVLTTTHEHIGGLCCWQLISARRGVKLRTLELPVPAADPDEIVGLFARAITPRTRVISVSHVNFTNGLVMPVREIVRLCRDRGLISVVDGAHPPGLMRISVREIDPDFYASSPHKWLLAPQGTGFLYIRENWRRKLWPTLASGDWDNLSLGAQRFNHLGSFDESRMAGLLAAVRFHDAIGAERIEARARALRRQLHDALSSMRGVTLFSPAREDMVAGMISFRLERVESLELQRRLAEKANVRTRVIGEYDYGWMRLSPFIYNSPEEIDKVVELIASHAAAG
jgi:isopenicillin-N epimerase